MTHQPHQQLPMRRGRGGEGQPRQKDHKGRQVPESPVLIHHLPPCRAAQPPILLLGHQGLGPQKMKAKSLITS